MAKYKINERTSTLDKNTKIVNVTKEKDLSETLFGSKNDDSKIKSGKYVIHESDSLIDKNTKIVSVTREKSLSETILGTEEEIKQKELKQKEKYEREKNNNKKYLDKQNQKLIDDYNDLLKYNDQLNKKMTYDNKVVSKDFTAGVSSIEFDKVKNSFDYNNASMDKKKEYLKFVAKYLNSMYGGYSTNFIRMKKKKFFKNQKDKYYDGPKYWEIKKDETEYEKNKGYDINNSILIIDENGEFWIKNVCYSYGGYNNSKSLYFNKIEKFDDDNLIYLDIYLSREKINLNFEKFLSLNNDQLDKMIDEVKDCMLDKNVKFKEMALKRQKSKRLINVYKYVLLFFKFFIFPLLLLPIYLVFIKASLILVIIVAIIMSIIYGFVKEYLEIVGFLYTMSLIITSILMLIRGYSDVFKLLLIMLVLSIVITFISNAIENKISKKISKIELY